MWNPSHTYQISSDISKYTLVAWNDKTCHYWPQAGETPKNYVNVQKLRNQKPSAFIFKGTYVFSLSLNYFSISYFANEKRFHLFLADGELGDVIGGIPKSLIHHIVGIH